MSDISAGDDDAVLVPGPEGTMITRSEAVRLRRLTVYCSHAPAGSTQAAVDFLSAGHDLMHFLGHSFDLAKRLDTTLHIVLESLPEDERTPIINYSEVTESYRPLVAQLLVARAVDLFLTYISKLLTLIFITKPHTMRTTALIPVDFVLNHDSMDELIRALADERIARLAYQGMRELSRDIEKQLGFKLYEKDSDLAAATEAIEVRNVIVHNDGIIDNKFKRKLSHIPGSVGERLIVESPTTTAVDLAFLLLDIDRRAREKFDLPSFSGHYHPPRCERLGYDPRGRSPSDSSR